MGGNFVGVNGFYGFNGLYIDGVNGLNIIIYIGVFPSELQSNKIFIRIRYFGRKITDEDGNGNVIINESHHPFRGQHLVKPLCLVDCQRSRFHLVLTLDGLVVELRLMSAYCLTTFHLCLDGSRIIEICRLHDVESALEPEDISWRFVRKEDIKMS